MPCNLRADCPENGISSGPNACTEYGTTYYSIITCSSNRKMVQKYKYRCKCNRDRDVNKLTLKYPLSLSAARNRSQRASVDSGASSLMDDTSEVLLYLEQSISAPWAWTPVTIVHISTTLFTKKISIFLYFSEKTPNALCILQTLYMQS